MWSFLEDLFLGRNLPDPVKATPEDFLAWARTKRRGKRFDYTSSHGCVYAQFLRHLGVTEPMVTVWCWYAPLDHHWRVPIPEPVARGIIDTKTFGEAVVAVVAELEMESAK